MNRARVGADPGGISPTLVALIRRNAQPEPPLPAASAAALIPLVEWDGEPHVLLIERADQPDDLASGQVGLPGGHVDPEDRSLLSTALREFEEEIGLSREDLLAPPSFFTVREARVFRLHVAVFAAMVRPNVVVPAGHQPSEVKEAFWLPRSALATQREVERSTPQGPAVVEATVFQNHVLWGFTRRVLLDFFGVP